MKLPDLQVKPSNTEMSTLVETNKVLLNPSLTDDWRVRIMVKEKIEQAAKQLPKGLCLMVFEAYRSIERQQMMWDAVYQNVQLASPHFNAQQIYDEAAKWISPPDGFGSGHLSGAAIDVTLATPQRDLVDMGTGVQEFNSLTVTKAAVSQKVKDNRDILVSCLQSQGLINYPQEWWHFSYGDRLWAELSERDYIYFTPHNI
ncbi:MAG: M15 family metallopeptidase [Oceanospirillaceae bacterium]